MRRPRPLLLLSLCTACGADAGPGLLSERARFDGPLSITVEAGPHRRVLAGHLSFDRAADALTFTRRLDGRTVALTRRGGAGLIRSVDGRDEPAGLDDEGDLALLLTVLRAAPGPQSGIRPLADGYAIEAGEQRIEVRFDPSRG